MRFLNRLVAVFWGALMTPAVSFACATCSDPDDASNGAFLASTIFLSLLPLAGIGGLVYGVYRHMTRMPERPRVSPH